MTNDRIAFKQFVRGKKDLSRSAPHHCMPVILALSVKSWEDQRILPPDCWLTQYGYTWVYYMDICDNWMWIYNNLFNELFLWIIKGLGLCPWNEGCISLGTPKSSQPIHQIPFWYPQNDSCYDHRNSPIFALKAMVFGVTPPIFQGNP